jgi:signal transduction histidine kinase
VVFSFDGMTAAAVRAEQIRTLYRQSVPVLSTSLVNAIIVSATVWGSASRPLLLGWTGIMALMTVVRLWLRREFWRTSPGPEQARRWGSWFVAGSVTAGVLWGGSTLWVMDPRAPLSLILFTFVLGGMSAGAAGTISCYLPAFFGFLLPAILPLAARLFAVGGQPYLALGIMLVVYALAMAAVAHTANRSITAAFALRFENVELVDRLSRAQLSLEETNRTLEQRVAERSLALERQGEALRNAQRMEAVGRLAGGIAHDFNNLLTVVLGNTTRLLRESHDADTGAALEDVRSAASRGAELVRQLLAFSRRQRLAPSVLDLNEVVGELERLLAPLIGEAIELRIAPAAERLLVRADRGQLGQVLVNLATNARDAMPEGGKLLIATAGVEIAAGHPTLAPGRYAVLAVSDTGVGMEPDTRRRAFDPFFTTKALGKGTGLGLATVYGIVEQSGGRITLESEPGSGTRFDVYLPRLSEGEALAESQTPPPASGPHHAATIVVAEDEPMVRSVIKHVLEGAGHRILAAEDGEQALGLVLGHAGPIDLLISDIAMPKLDGHGLARQVREQRPGVRVLLISGHGWQAEAPASPSTTGIHFLQKPFSAELLLETVAGVLGSPRA